MRLLKKQLRLLLLALVILCFAQNANSDVILFDHFDTLVGWTYDPGNCPGFSVATDMSMLYVESYGSCGTNKCDQWEGIQQTLCQTITPDQDFTVCFKPVVLTDNPGEMGGVQVSCLNDADEVVAVVKWYEPQAGTGYGGVSFYAEGNLIYGDESGFDTEYPTINDVMRLRRIGDHWSAWVNGLQKGSDFILTPTMTISKIKVEFYNFVGWTERDIKVDFVTLTASTPVWCDDFESYPLGSFPSPPWCCTGNCGASDAYNDDSVSFSGSQSLRLYGDVGGCWAAIVNREIGTSPPYSLELCVYNGTEDLSGCHPYRASIHLRSAPGCDWTLPARRIMEFYEDGRIRLHDSIGWHYDELEWIRVRVDYSRPTEDTVHLAFWVNCELLYEVDIPPVAWEDDLAYIDLAAQEGTVWFDDVCITRGPCLTISSMITPDTMYAFQANSIDPLMDTVDLYAFPEGYSASDIDPSTLHINCSVAPTSSSVTSEDTLEITFPMRDFILSYGPLWDTTNQVFTVSGQFNDATCFSSAGEVTMIGHVSGDINFDGAVNVADLTYLIDFLFTGGPPPPIMVAADLDGSCAVNVADVTYFVDYLFGGGPKPTITCESL